MSCLPIEWCKEVYMWPNPSLLNVEHTGNSLIMTLHRNFFACNGTREWQWHCNIWHPLPLELYTSHTFFVLGNNQDNNATKWGTTIFLFSRQPRKWLYNIFLVIYKTQYHPFTANCPNEHHLLLLAKIHDCRSISYIFSEISPLFSIFKFL